MTIWKRGGIVLALVNGHLQVTVDAAKVAVAEEFKPFGKIKVFDVDVELVAKDAQREGRRFWDNVKAEWERWRK